MGPTFRAPTVALGLGCKAFLAEGFAILAQRVFEAFFAPAPTCQLHPHVPFHLQVGGGSSGCAEIPKTATAKTVAVGRRTIKASKIRKGTAPSCGLCCCYGCCRAVRTMAKRILSYQAKISSSKNIPRPHRHAKYSSGQGGASQRTVL